MVKIHQTQVGEASGLGRVARVHLVGLADPTLGCPTPPLPYHITDPCHTVETQFGDILHVCLMAV